MNNNTNNNKPLWKPKKNNIQKMNVTHFIKALEAQHNISIKNTQQLHQFSINQPEKFWSAISILANIYPPLQTNNIISNKSNMLNAKFFNNSSINFAQNLLKRKDNEIAIITKTENNNTQYITWKELYQKTANIANALKNLGAKKGDRIAAVTPNIPETIIACLATTSIGAIWTSCSPDFGSNGIIDRFGQAKPKILFATDGYSYNGKIFNTKDKIIEIINNIKSIKYTIITPMINENTCTTGIPNAHKFQELEQQFHTNKNIQFQPLNFNDDQFILYSSGTTGKPKCIVHSVGGSLLKIISEQQLQCDLKANDRMMFFTTCGWMMWNWLITCLASNATPVLYDGAPLYPNHNALWDLADENNVTHFGASAKYLDAIANAKAMPKKTHNLKYLRCLLTTGSPLLPEQFDYVYNNIKSDIHLASISGGTDILGLFVGGDPTIPVYRGEIQAPALGMAVEVYNENGKIMKNGKGELVCTAPFPSQPTKFWGDSNNEKYYNAYFKRFHNVWTHGDFIEITQNNGYIIHGRSDATLNPAGVRIGTAEIYSQTEALTEIAEAIVIGQNWQNDTRIILFVRMQNGHKLNETLKQTIKNNIKKNCSPRHVPAKIIAVNDIPRTRSGKITEIAVRDIVNGKPINNKSALANPEALNQFKDITELQS